MSIESENTRHYTEDDQGRTSETIPEKTVGVFPTEGGEPYPVGTCEFPDFIVRLLLIDGPSGTP